MLEKRTSSGMIPIQGNKRLLGIMYPYGPEEQAITPLDPRGVLSLDPLQKHLDFSIDVDSVLSSDTQCMDNPEPSFMGPQLCPQEST